MTILRPLGSFAPSGCFGAGNFTLNLPFGRRMALESGGPGAPAGPGVQKVGEGREGGEDMEDFEDLDGQGRSRMSWILWGAGKIKRAVEIREADSI